jgi:hypothetical protein
LPTAHNTTKEGMLPKQEAQSRYVYICINRVHIIMSSKPVSASLMRIIARDLGLDLDPHDNINYGALVDLVADRVIELLEGTPETLFSLLYRLDVSEKKVDQLIKYPSGEATNVSIARLIIQRQKERILTKQKYKQGPLKDWENWS